MRYLIAAVLLLMFAGLSQAATVSVAVETVKVTSDPVIGGYVVVEVPRYYPLITDGEEGDFYRVSDFKGRSGWVRKAHVAQTPAVVVVVPSANVREKPSTSNRIVFRANKGVAFKVLEETPQWFHVEHERGKSGWIAKSLT
ncbi:MAG: SH3 domain-containing protein, partial [Desulfuromonas sp.]|nr:SH3 domain-containing protein [Desulfuromonas sp.]